MPDLAYVLGRVAPHKGDDASAEKLLTAAFEELPAEIGHGAWLAQLYYETQRPVEALRVLSEALRHRPDDAALHQLREEVLADVWTHGDNVSD